MKKKLNLNLLIMIVSTIIFVGGCSEERSVAPAPTGPANGTSSGEQATEDGTSSDPAADLDNSSSADADGGV